MGCILTVLARLTLFFVWLLTPLVHRAFDGGWVLPLLGFIFLPITTLTYTIVYAVGHGVTGWAWIWIAVAVLFDLGTHGSGAYANRNRFPGYRASGRGTSAPGV